MKHEEDLMARIEEAHKRRGRLRIDLSNYRSLWACALSERKCQALL